MSQVLTRKHEIATPVSEAKNHTFYQINDISEPKVINSTSITIIESWVATTFGIECEWNRDNFGCLFVVIGIIALKRLILSVRILIFTMPLESKSAINQ